MSPAVGWVRANTVGNEELLSELNEIRKQNDALKARLKEVDQQSVKNIDRLAGLDEIFTIRGSGYNRYNQKEAWSERLTWKEIFASLAPYLINIPNDEYVKIMLTRILVERAKIHEINLDINDQDFQTVKLQLKALGLINLNYTKTTMGNMALFWSLTKSGEQLMLDVRTIPPATSLVDFTK